MEYLSEIIAVAVSALFSGLGGFALSRWWDTNKLRLQWFVFPPVSMMTIHSDVAEKLKVSYGKYEITNLTKRRFLLRNTGYRDINDETRPLQCQAPGFILDCSTSPAGGCESRLKVSVNSEDRRKIDIHWEEYISSGHQEYVDVLYDDRKELHSVRLSGSRRQTTILPAKHVPSDYEQRRVTRKLIGWSAIGGGVAGLAIFTVSITGNEAFPPFFGPLVAYVVTIMGTVIAFARARIGIREKTN